MCIHKYNLCRHGYYADAFIGHASTCGMDCGKDAAVACVSSLSGRFNASRDRTRTTIIIKIIKSTE